MVTKSRVGLLELSHKVKNVSKLYRFDLILSSRRRGRLVGVDMIVRRLVGRS